MSGHLGFRAVSLDLLLVIVLTPVRQVNLLRFLSCGEIFDAGVAAKGR
jgi:hypothetical protein